MSKANHWLANNAMLDALGIDGDKVVEVDIRLSVDKLPTIKVTSLLVGQDIKKVEGFKLVPESQAE